MENNRNKYFALFNAAKSGDVNQVRSALESGIDVDYNFAHNPYPPRTVLYMITAHRYDNIENVILFLLARGAKESLTEVLSKSYARNL